MDRSTSVPSFKAGLFKPVLVRVETHPVAAELVVPHLCSVLLRLLMKLMRAAQQILHAEVL